MLNKIYKRAVRAFQAPIHPSKLASWKSIKNASHGIRFDHSVDGIEGWLTPNEKQVIYALGFVAPGPMLEIGSWAGLSTSCLAYGIKDSKRKIRFVAREFNPTFENFRPVEGGIGFFLKPDVCSGLCSKESYERDIVPIISRPGGILGQLRKNLTERGLIDLVTISIGNFKEMKHESFGFVFCDALHDPGEIELNAPYLKGFLTNGTILACHDSNPENEKCLKRFFKFKESFTVDSLFVGEVVMTEEG
jgi:hypothetical protein